MIELVIHRVVQSSKVARVGPHDIVHQLGILLLFIPRHTTLGQECFPVLR